MKCAREQQAQLVLKSHMMCMHTLAGPNNPKRPKDSFPLLCRKSLPCLAASSNQLINHRTKKLLVASNSTSGTFNMSQHLWNALQQIPCKYEKEEGGTFFLGKSWVGSRTNFGRSNVPRGISSFPVRSAHQVLSVMICPSCCCVVPH